MINEEKNMIQRLEISKMIYIDDFFLVIGYYSNDNNENEYLFLTKDGEIKDYFKLHSNTLAIKKINLKDTKLIVSLGYDLIPEEDGEYQEESKLPKTEIVERFWVLQIYCDEQVLHTSGPPSCGVQSEGALSHLG